jgi:phosphatidate cytidylyltransferase
MKTRIISATVALLIAIPLIILGGNFFAAGVAVLGLFGLKEFMDLKEIESKIPNAIKLISILCYSLIVLSNFEYQVILFDSAKNIALTLFLLLMPILLYHDNKKYNINDAFFLIAAVMFLGIAFNYLIVIRNTNLNILIYLLLVTFLTDTFAFFTGLLIGRHKLCPEISPKKTIEGLIGGLVVSTIVSTIFYATAFGYPNTYKIVIVSLLFSLISQIGDMIFSAFKRQYKIKDFSNIMPGHGGILDRLDSLIFILISYSIIISIL